MRIGLDIDDCLADFWGAYCKYFDVEHNPKMAEDAVITKNVQNILSKDKNFWLSLEVLNFPDFIPELYCTKRINNKRWTKEWLKINGFPERPVYQMYYQYGNKASMLKGRVDVFIDDSIRNVIACNKSGVVTLLLNNERNEEFPMFKVYSLKKESIMDSFLFMKEYGEGIF